MLASPELYCRFHRQLPAEHFCETCSAPVCDACAEEKGAGKYQCPGCANGGTTADQAGETVAVSGARTMCVTHREVPATAVCCICRTPICATCDFVFSYHHYCPHCAVSMGEKMSPAKRRMRTWSFILAIVATVLMAGSIVLINMADSEEAETLFGLVLFASAGASFVGAVLGMSARDKGTEGRGSVWAAIAWNGLIVVCFVFLIIVGLLVE